VALNRSSQKFAQLAEQTYDLCIIGGGIYGAWAARDAALRGLSVILIDRGDWGGATSQSSSKLLHGGLRYLEQFEFGLVRKSLLERELLSKLASHLVKPLRFMVPLYDDSRLGPFRLRLGLKLYDGLSGHGKIASPSLKLNEGDVFKSHLWLRREGFKAALEYSDAQTDDARLVFQVVGAAMVAGAELRSYTEATITHAVEELKRVELQDVLTHETVHVKCRSILMTTGPWLDAQVGRQAKAREKSRLTKGVHLIMPDCGLNRALTLMAPEDGRVFFMIPWYKRTLLGTTDSDYQGEVSDCKTTQAEVDYLLRACNAFMQADYWKREDVISTFCGLRVLQASDSEHPSQASREWSLPEIRPGVFRSVGGKLTSARQDAVTAVSEICAVLGKQELKSLSHEVDLPSVPEASGDYAELLNREFGALNLDDEVIDNLVYRYGKAARGILLDLQDSPERAQRICEELPFIEAEFDYILNNEMVVRLEDLLRRRLPLMILMRYCESVLNKSAEKAAQILGWDQARMELEMAHVKEQWQCTTP